MSAMRKRRTLAAVATVAVGLSLGGCSSENPSGLSDAGVGRFQGNERQVAQAMVDYRNALADGDSSRACESFPPSQFDFGGDRTKCERAMERLVEKIDPEELEFQIEGIDIDGNRAEVEIVSTGQGGNERTTSSNLLREQGRWYVLITDD